MALVTTPGASTANAYCSIAEADAYCGAHVAGAAWLAATDETKEAAIKQATRELDIYVAWTGAPTYIGVQALAWPRVGMYYPSTNLWDPATWRLVGSTEIPARLKNACAEQARLLIAGDRTAELDQQTQGISKIDVAGAVAIDFAGPTEIAPRQVVASSAWAFVSCWGTMQQANRGGPVPLIRT